MEIKWITVTGSQEQKPDAIDKTSSSKYVYLRRNIERTTKTDDNGTVFLWRYEEAVVTQEEYARYDNVIMEVVQAAIDSAAAEQERKNDEIQAQIAAVQANTEYIAMMQDIDLEV